MTDFGALCAELVDALDSGIPTARIRMSPLADRARAALAQPEPVADGEVGELVAALRADAECAEVEHYDLCNMTSGQMRRAADLLERQHPQLVPVSERWPGAKDVYFEFSVFDADYCTQAGGTAPTYAQALSEGEHYLAQYLQDGPHTLELRRIEILNPHTLTLPTTPKPEIIPKPQFPSPRKISENFL